MMSNDNEPIAVTPFEPRPKASGRPTKQNIAKKSKGGRNKVGRPKGDASIINEYKSRMLASPRSKKVMDTIFEAALDHDHRNQAAAWKLVMDRILPVAAFEKDIVKDAGRNAIQINITGVGATSITNAAEKENEEEDPVITIQDPSDQDQH
tara:strand:- start:884 stop:1336 length:453 start_codon:yes stop_codon:yes gene_type:complete